MQTYSNLIDKNKAPKGARYIGAFNAEGELIGKTLIPDSMKAPETEPLYKVGIFSDVHLWDRDIEGSHGNYQIGAQTDEDLYYGGSNHKYDSTSFSDLVKYQQFAENDENVEFHCFCGDMTSGYKDNNGGSGTSGTTKVAYGGDGNTWKKEDEASMWQIYTEEIFSKPIYSTNGNHDCYAPLVGSTYSDCNTAFNTYFGHDLCYTHTKGNDLYIFIGMVKNSKNGDMLFNQELQWLYETLEANIGKRCFIFLHAPYAGCVGGYANDTSIFMLTGTQATVFKSLLSHYKNCLFFHGHSHASWVQQTKSYPSLQRIDNAWDIHVSSLAQPREYIDGTRTVLFHKGQAFIAEIYENGVFLKGREIGSINGIGETEQQAYLPIAQFWLDTTIQTVEPGTYTDPTGTITV